MLIGLCTLWDLLIEFGTSGSLNSSVMNGKRHQMSFEDQSQQETMLFPVLRLHSVAKAKLKQALYCFSYLYHYVHMLLSLYFIYRSRDKYINVCTYSPLSIELLLCMDIGACRDLIEWCICFFFPFFLSFFLFKPSYKCNNIVFERQAGKKSFLQLHNQLKPVITVFGYYSVLFIFLFFGWHKINISLS